MKPEEILDVIARCAREVVPELRDHVFRGDDRLQDLGANSVDRAEIIVMVLEQLSLNIPRVETFGPDNVGELARLLHARLA